MRSSIRIPLIVILPIFFIMLSCTPYVVTTKLEKPLDSPASCSIGIITDELPEGMDMENRPTIEEIDNLKDKIMERLEEREVFSVIGSGADYEVRGSILEFKRGSGTVRFLIGFGLGNAKMVTSLELVDQRTGNVVFGGNFDATVSSWAESGDKIYHTISDNFAKALKKQNEKLLKE
jgi:hypothetical protein